MSSAVRGALALMSKTSTERQTHHHETQNQRLNVEVEICAPRSNVHFVLI
jgi:hypothetical protein